MQSFFSWFANAFANKEQPWLILGKGPSFSKLPDFDISSFGTISLNHAVRERPVDIAHIIDFDVVDQCGESLLHNARVLVMPWHPHVHNKSSPETLEDMVCSNSILFRLKNEGRLLWYNLSTAKDHRVDGPVVRVRYFSAEAALNLLAAAGVRQVRSLGVDGGASYSFRFDDLKDKTLLANSRTSFDDQFQEIARAILTTGVDYAPLDMESPIRVFVAATEAQMLAVKVLEYSIKKHTSMTAEVFPMHRSKIEIPMPREKKNQPRTPFSFQRFLIPELMNWHGRAIYLDSDMQVFKDMRELWTLPFNGAQLLAAREPGDTGRRPQFSVTVLDCSKLKWRISEIVCALDDGRLSYEDLMYRMTVADDIRVEIDSSWNSLEHYVAGETALLHYTDMDRQPWVSRANSLGHLWVAELIEAIDSGFIRRELVDEDISRGWVRPSLAWQIEHRVTETTALPREVQRLDIDFSAPYQSLSKPSVTQRHNQISNLKHGSPEHEARIASLNQAVVERDAELCGIRQSASWRLTRPLRFLGHQRLRLRYVRQALPSILETGGGYRGVLRKAWRILRREGVVGINHRILVAARTSTAAQFPANSSSAIRATNLERMSRGDKVFFAIDRNGLGLEIGPSHKPLAPKKQGYRVKTMDHATREELMEKYEDHGVDTDQIEEVDYVWRGEPIDELVGLQTRFDYIIASHLIEHTPDLVSFLRQLSNILKPDGVISLVIPDKRYCFDYYRFPSSTGDVLQAYLEKRKTHAPGVVFDHFAHAAKMNGSISWAHQISGKLSLVHSFEEARDGFEQAKTSVEYIDVHHWRFTPASFRLILSDLRNMELIDLIEEVEFETAGCEFFVTLKKGKAAEQKPRITMLNDIAAEATEGYANY